MDNLNIEEILEEIRANLEETKRQRIANGEEELFDASRQAESEEVASYRLQREKYEVFEYLNHEYVLDDYLEMGGGLKGNVKKALQKANRLNTAPLAKEQSDFNGNVVHGMNLMRGELESLVETVALLRKRVDEQDRLLNEYSNNLTRIIDTVSKMSVATPTVQVVQQAEGAVAAAAPVANTSEDYYEDLDYLEFQNAFRGSVDDIMNRMRIYEPYFRDAKGTVLDFGCGRGEFLLLMKELGVDAIGVDPYKAYEAMGAMKGIQIVTDDGVKFLQNAKEPFGGIFVGQVVEHIGFPNIVKLCKLAYEKLQPGGYLVMETPNAACLAIYTNSFYLDPTHQNPVHPLLLQYIAKAAGFSSVEIVYTEGSRCDIEIPEIQSDSITNLEEVNKALHRVSETLFGSMDYAVVARK